MRLHKVGFWFLNVEYRIHSNSVKVSGVSLTTSDKWEKNVGSYKIGFQWLWIHVIFVFVALVLLCYNVEFLFCWSAFFDRFFIYLLTQPYPCICKEAVFGFEPMTNKSPRHNFTADILQCDSSDTTSLSSATSRAWTMDHPNLLKWEIFVVVSR